MKFKNGHIVWSAMYHRPRQPLNLYCPIFRGNFELGIKRNDEPLERYNQSYISQVYCKIMIMQAHETSFFFAF